MFSLTLMKQKMDELSLSRWWNFREQRIERIMNLSNYWKLCYRLSIYVLICLSEYIKNVISLFPQLERNKKNLPRTRTGTGTSSLAPLSHELKVLAHKRIHLFAKLAYKELVQMEGNVVASEFILLIAYYIHYLKLIYMVYFFSNASNKRTQKSWLNKIEFEIFCWLMQCKVCRAESEFWCCYGVSYCSAECAAQDQCGKRHLNWKIPKRLVPLSYQKVLIDQKRKTAYAEAAARAAANNDQPLKVPQLGRVVRDF